MTMTTTSTDTTPLAAVWASCPTCGYYSMVSDPQIGIIALTAGCPSGSH